MAGLNGGLKGYLILVAVSTLISDRISHGFETTVEVEESRRSKREDPTSSINTQPGRLADREQRLCLHRLKDALQDVCSIGSGTKPLYFDPHSYRLSTSGNASSFSNGRQRKSRHLKNGISAMAQRSRPLLRRRSRRNIVRECCHRPCSYSSLRKYCMPSVSRLHRLQVTSSSPATNQLGKNGKLSRSIHGYPTVGIGLSANYLNYDESNDNNIDTDVDDTLPSSIQCIPVSELKSYFRKLYQIQTKKDGLGQSATVAGSESSIVPGSITTYSDDDDDGSNPSRQSNKLLNTNIILSEGVDILENEKDDLTGKLIRKNSQKLSTEEPTPIEQNRQENEIPEDELEVEETSSNTIQWNVMTERPITRFVSLPRGTNDYVY